MHKYHYTVQGYDEIVGEDQRLLNVVQLHVRADTEDEALAKAKEMLYRPLYRVAEIVECVPEEHPNFMLNQEILQQIAAGTGDNHES